MLNQNQNIPDLTALLKHVLIYVIYIPSRANVSRRERRVSRFDRNRPALNHGSDPRFPDNLESTSPIRVGHDIHFALSAGGKALSQLRGGGPRRKTNNTPSVRERRCCKSLFRRTSQATVIGPTSILVIKSKAQKRAYYSSVSRGGNRIPLFTPSP